jgi:hypothetical protein
MPTTDPAARLHQAADTARTTTALPEPLREPLATLLETEARVDTEDRAALAAEGRDPEAEHRSCTTTSCTTLAALAVADALLGEATR